jgi:peptidyl-prolyl cis-trans isomerase SurA
MIKISRFRICFITFLCAAFLCLGPAVALADNMRIAAVVNEDAISQADVMERMKLVLASSGLPNKKEVYAKVLPQVVNSLIEDQIKLQEAARNEIDVTEEDVMNGFNTVAAQNNMSGEQFMQIMQRQGISPQTLLNQIRAQIAWSKVVKQVLQPKIRVNRNDVAAKIKRMKDNIGKTEYLTAEIFLPVDGQTKEADVQKLAEELVKEINQNNVPFPAVAAQFSKAPGARDTGGMIGWVQEGQLEPALNQRLAQQEPGKVSQPIKSELGYHILLVREKRTINAENLPPENAVMDQIALERLEKMQQRYLTDLKASAFVDVRG